MSEDKESSSSVIEKTTQSVVEIVPILEKHPKGFIYLLLLTSLISFTLITLDFIKHSSSKKEEKIKDDKHVNSSENVKQLEGEDYTDKLWEIKN